MIRIRPIPNRHGIYGPKRRPAFSLIELLVVIAIIGLLLSITLSIVHRVRETARRATCANQMRQLAVALQSYHSQFHHLPPGCSNSGPNEPFPHMSWCARLLPFLGHGALWDTTVAAYAQDKFFRNNPPHVGVSMALPNFFCPTGTRDKRVVPTFTTAFTYYLGVEGTNQFKKDGVLYLNSKTVLSNVLDGQSCTLMIGERPPNANGNLGWWYGGWGQDRDGSAEMILGAREKAVHRTVRHCDRNANRYAAGQIDNPCDALTSGPSIPAEPTSPCATARSTS